MGREAERVLTRIKRLSLEDGCTRGEAVLRSSTHKPCTMGSHCSCQLLEIFGRGCRPSWLKWDALSTACEGATTAACMVKQHIWSN